LKSFFSFSTLAIALCFRFTAPTPGHSTGRAVNPTVPTETRNVIIDTDPGTDDAMAILLALNSPELNVKAITVVPGNAPGKQVLENGLRLVSLANRCDIPVAAGALEPMFQKLITNDAVHGKNGLGDIELPPSKCRVDPRFGPDLIIEMAHQMPHEITLIAIGPLTNLALALQKDPSVSSLIKEVIIMGGSINGGNSTAAAEANIFGDPEAAQIVFQAGWKVTMCTLGIGAKTVFTRERLATFSRTHGPENDFAVEVINRIIGYGEKLGWGGMRMYDPTAVAAALDSTLVETEFWHVDVETQGAFTRGETVANRINAVERRVWRGDRYVFEGFDPVQPNVHVAVNIDADRFLNLFVARLSGK
jgi:inosine-uridine nucleoside N-ribohydrolase